MGSIAADRPHAVFVPFPAQGHVTPLLKLAKILHSRGFHVTFVNTHYNHARLLRSRGSAALEGVPGFRFASIPDGLPESDAADVTQSVPDLCRSTKTTCLAPFRDLLAELNHPSSGVPPVSCVVADGVMSFTLDAAEELGVPEVLFWTTSACGFMGYLYYQELVDRGLTPLQDMSQLDKEYLEREIDGIPGMEGIRFKDFPSFVRTADPDDIMLNFMLHETSRVSKATAVVLNTFHDLEASTIEAMSAIVRPPVTAIGPLNLLEGASDARGNLWKEDLSCFEWLEGRPEASVVFVNFGSVAIMSREQLVEFAWGLAGCGCPFLWVIRPDVVREEGPILPEEFLEETRGRGMLASWCPQEEVLRHPAVGGFLTHCGWNSTLESLCGGVPVVCWPFFAEQQMNCRYLCGEWGVGMEADGFVKRGEVEVMLREMITGEKGRKMREKARGWKERAAAAVAKGGSSAVNIDQLVRMLSGSGSVMDIQ